MSWEKYPSIKFEPGKIQDKVWVLEKVDGANFSVCVEHNDTLSFYSRQLKLDEEAAGQFGPAIKLANSFRDAFKSFPAYTTFFFEYYGCGIQKRIPYCDDKKLILIDIRCGDYFVPYDKMIRFAELFDIPVIPAYFGGLPQDITEVLIAYIQQGKGPFNKSLVAEGDDKPSPEGVILRPVTELPGQERRLTKVKLDSFAMREQKSVKIKTFKAINQEMVLWCRDRVNVDRISSVYSHGEFEPSYSMLDMRSLVSLVPTDILSEGDCPYSEIEVRKTVPKLLPNALRAFLESRNGE